MIKQYYNNEGCIWMKAQSSQSSAKKKKMLYKRRGGRKQASKKKKTIYILNETTKNDHEFQGFNITQTL